MKSEHAAPTMQDAKVIVRLLVEAFPTIDAVLLGGSVARGDADEWSDIDLVVVASDPDLSLAVLRKALSEDKDRVSLIYYPTSSFRKLYEEHALFIAHLQREGVALYDPKDLLKDLLGRPFVPVVDVAGEIQVYRARLAPYTDPRRFNNNFLFCLSHLYSIGKGVIMLGLAKRGVFEFNRENAFGRFAKLNPDLATVTNSIARLRPFYRLVTDRRPEPLPFSYESAGRQMLEAVHAIEIVAGRVEHP
jgi:predicted nucleotidyltransferase